MNNGEKSRSNHAPGFELDRRRWDKIFEDHPLPDVAPVKDSEDKDENNPKDEN